MDVFTVAIRSLHISSVLAFLSSFKNYIPHGQTDRHTHTHTMYIITMNVAIILIFTYENKKYTRSSKLTM